MTCGGSLERCLDLLLHMQICVITALGLSRHVYNYEAYYFNVVSCGLLM